MILAWLRAFGISHWLMIVAIVAGIGWHYADRYAAVSAERAKWETKIEDATKAAAADHAAQQQKIDELASSDQAQLAQKVKAQQALVDKLLADAKNPPKVFTKDCTLPVEQVKEYNGIK